MRLAGSAEGGQGSRWWCWERERRVVAEVVAGLMQHDPHGRMTAEAAKDALGTWEKGRRRRRGSCSFRCCWRGGAVMLCYVIGAALLSASVIPLTQVDGSI